METYRNKSELEDKQKLYANRFGELGGAELKQKNAVWFCLCHHFFQKYIEKDDNILDLAAGYCEFINNIRTDGKKYAIDANVDILNFAGKDVNAFNGDVFNVKSMIPENSIDVIFISNFLEHLDNKAQVIELLNVLRPILKENGRIMILQPNIRYVGGAYWDFIDHKVPLTEKSLEEAAAGTDYEVVTTIKKFLPYTTKSKIPKVSWLIRAYLMFMPMSSEVMGKQSFMIMRKK